MNSGGGAAPAGLHPAVTAVFQKEYSRVLAALMRSVRDLELAEDSLSEAISAALEHWPQTGLPERPGAWLLVTARRKALDQLRRRKNAELHRPELIWREHEQMEARLRDPTEPLTDDRLRLMFMCCHPALPREMRLALALETLGGLTPKEIAAVFFVPTATISQRLTRCKRKIRDGKIRFEIPNDSKLDDRLQSVLEVISSMFTEGHLPSQGPHLVRGELCDEAIRLGRWLSFNLPEQPETEGLLALMLLTDARRMARTDASGDLIPLDEQDRSRWDREKIAEGTARIERALMKGHLGPFQLQAAIAAVHAEAETASETDWGQIALLYDELERLNPTFAILLNQIIAWSMAEGPEIGWKLLEDLEREPFGPRLASICSYHLTRADLLVRRGCLEQARSAYARARELADNRRVQRFIDRKLLQRVG